MPEFRMVDCGEVTLRCAIEGPEPGTAPLAIMVHGFPESWYSWRHQLAPVAAAGYTACAIDVRGWMKLPASCRRQRAMYSSWKGSVAGPSGRHQARLRLAAW